MTRKQEEMSVDRMPYPRFIALAVGIVVGLWALGYLPTRRFVGEEAMPAMLMAGVLALVASLVGTLPLLNVRGRPPVEKVSAVLGAIALRLLAILVLAAAVLLSGFLAGKPFLVWVVLTHLGLLIADTLFAKAEMRADDRALRA